MYKPILPFLIIAIVIIAMKFIIKRLPKTLKSKSIFSAYKKKKYLFDTTTEFNLYKALLEIFGDEYFIFPQINYSHLIEPRKATWKEERKYRSRIDRKSADFVFCDKQQVIPMLVIELDGSVHDFRGKKARDKFINELMETVDLPILHLKVGDINREFIEMEIRQALKKLS